MDRGRGVVEYFVGFFVELAVVYTCRLNVLNVFFSCVCGRLFLGVRFHWCFWMFPFGSSG